MINLLSLGSILVAIGVSMFYGYRYSQVKSQLKDEKSRSKVKDKVIQALKGTIEHDQKLNKILEEIDDTNSADELNKLYNKILTGSSSDRT